jgi:hypothetical protein
VPQSGHRQSRFIEKTMNLQITAVTNCGGAEADTTTHGMKKPGSQTWPGTLREFQYPEYDDLGVRSTKI